MIVTALSLPYNTTNTKSLSTFPICITSTDAWTILRAIADTSQAEQTDFTLFFSFSSLLPGDTTSTGVIWEAHQLDERIVEPAGATGLVKNLIGRHWQGSLGKKINEYEHWHGHSKTAVKKTDTTLSLMIVGNISIIYIVSVQFVYTQVT